MRERIRFLTTEKLRRGETLKRIKAGGPRNTRKTRKKSEKAGIGSADEFGVVRERRKGGLKSHGILFPEFVEEAGGDDFAGPAGAGGRAEVDDGPVGELGGLEGVVGVAVGAEI